MQTVPRPLADPVLAAAVLTVQAVAVVGASAQAELTVEVGASHIGPSLDATAEDARFAIAGLRGGYGTLAGSGIFASVVAGQALDSDRGGSFLSGMIEARLVDRWTRTVDARLEARGLGFGVDDPFPYRAFALEGGPVVRYAVPDLTVEVAALGGVGRSELTLWRVADGPRRVFENDLWRGGGTVEVLLGPTTSQFGVVGGWHRTPSGGYSSVGPRAVFAGRWGIAELRADLWDTPFGSDVVAGLTVAFPLGSLWSLRGFFGRTDPDPLTLAQPGAVGGGFLVGRSLLSPSAGEEDRSIYEVVRATDESGVVRFTLRDAPTDAHTARILGDFTLWEPVSMQRDAEGWVIELSVPVGTHHFGFLVDDEWYLPGDAPDVVPDEWGRHSATLVIEGAS